MAREDSSHTRLDADAMATNAVEMAGSSDGQVGEADQSESAAADAARDTSHLFVFTPTLSNKAGIGADKKMVADFVYEMSKNSSYTQHQLDLDAKQQARTDAIVAELKALEARMTEAERALEIRKATEALDALEAHRCLSRTFCVVDMDMFYAAVEIRDRPHLANKPVAIGGIGMISTSNYVARLYGVRAAMPGFIAQEMVRKPHLVGSKMPPDELIFIPTDFAKYTRVAEETRRVFRDYDANLCAHTLDEAYLDLTEYLASRGGSAAAADVVQEMRNRIKETTGLTCSAGIAPNRMLAKIASDDNKPDGQSLIVPSRDAVLEYIENLPVRRVPGCGKVLERQLRLMFGVTTCGELRRAAAGIRRAFVGKKTCDYLLRLSLGLCSDELGDDGDVVGEVNRKSLSSETTFNNESSPDELRCKLLSLCRGVAEQMASSVPPLAAKIAALKVKASNFEVRNKQISNQRGFFGYDASFSTTSRSSSSKECTTHESGDVPNASHNEIGVASSWGLEAAWVRKNGSAVTATSVDNVVEIEVSRVTKDLYGALLPLLEEQFPCSLRLMGVRVSGFRGACTTLEKGQQQLQRFFNANIVGRPSQAVKTEQNGPQPSRASKAQREGGAAIVDVIDSSDEDTGATCRSKSETSLSISRAPSTVTCPVCGINVALAEADRHVNQHYDSQLPAQPSKELPAPAVKRRRKATTTGTTSHTSIQSLLLKVSSDPVACETQID